MKSSFIEQSQAWAGANPEAVRVARKLGLTSLQAIHAALSWPDNKAMKVVMGIAREADKHDFIKLDRDQPDQKEFAYHNWDLMRAPAALAWASIEAAKRGGLKVADGPTHSVYLDMNLVAKIYHEEGQAWAQKHQELVDDIMKGVISPWWLAGPALKAIKAPFIEAEIKALEGVVGSARGAMKDAPAVRSTRAAVDMALAKTYGAPLNAWARGVIASASTPRLAAEELYLRGYRHVDALGGVPRGFSVALDAVRPKFFRWPENFYSTDIRDMALRSLELQEALRANFGEVMDQMQKAFPYLTEADARDAAEVLLRVGRPQWMSPDRVPQFVVNEAHAAIMSGEWGAFRPSADAIMAAGEGGRYLKQGWRTGTAYDAKYWPKVKDVIEPTILHRQQALDAGKAEHLGESIWTKPRNWRKARVMRRATPEDAEEFRKALGVVLEREHRADRINGFRRMAARRIKDLRKLARADASQAPRWKQDIEDVRHVVNGLEDWSAKDFDMKKHGGALLRGWDRISNGFRVLQLGANPGWILKNAVDTHGTKNLIAADFDGAILNHVPMARRYNGKPLKVGQTMARDLLGPGGEESLASAVEHAGRAKLKSYVYQKEFAASVGRGIPAHLADEAADVASSEAERATHFNYTWLSGFENLMRRVYLYPKFGINDALFYANWAASHPSEAMAAYKTMELQHEHFSMDRQGFLRVPGTDMAINPWDQASFNRTMVSVADPKAPIDPDESEVARAIKTSQIVFGPLNPIVEGLAHLNDWTGQSPLQTVAGKVPAANIIKAVARIDAPAQEDPRAAKELTTSKTWQDLFLEAKKDPVRGRQIAMELAAAQASGRPMTIEEAEANVDSHNLKAQLSGLLLGVWPKRDAPGYEQVYDKINFHNNVFGQLSKEAEAKGDFEGMRAVEDAREAYREQNPEIKPLVPIYPGMEPRVLEKLDEINKNESKIEDIKDLPDQDKQGLLLHLPANLYAKAKDFLGSIKLRNPLEQEANASEEGPAAKPEETRIERRGRTWLADMPTAEDLAKMSPMDRARAMQTSARANTAFGVQLEELSRLPADHRLQASYIAQRPAFQAYLQKAAQDPRSGFTARNYLNLLDKPYGTELPDPIKNNRKGMQQELYSALSNAQADPAKLRQVWAQAGTAEGFKAAVQKTLKPGVDLSEIEDPKVLQGIRANLQQTYDIMLNKSGSIKKQIMQQQYPESAEEMKHLYDLSQPGRITRPGVAEALQNTIERQKQLVADGKLPPDWFKQVADTDPRMMERLAVAYQMPEIMAARFHVLRADQNGLPAHVDPAAMFGALKDGGGPAIAALRSFGDVRTQAALEDFNTRYNGVLDQHAPTDEHFMGAALMHPFNVAVGLEQNHLAAAITNSPFPVNAPSPAADLGQDFGRTPGMSQPFDTPHALDFAQSGQQLTPIRTQPYGSAYEAVSDIVSGTFSSTYTPKVLGPDGKYVDGQQQPSLSAGQIATAAGAVDRLGQVANYFAQDETLGKGVTGLGMGLSTYAALATLIPGIGWAGLAIGAGVGIAAGLFGGKKGGDGGAAEYRQQQLALEKQRFQEQMRQQDVRNLQSREKVLADAVRKIPRPLTSPLPEFHVRPTFSSRLGMVDQVERELASTLHPRF